MVEPTIAKSLKMNPYSSPWSSPYGTLGPLGTINGINLNMRLKWTIEECLGSTYSTHIPSSFPVRVISFYTYSHEFVIMSIADFANTKSMGKVNL